MLLHVPDGGGPTVLVSVPRDSYVPIPGHGKNKINAAYAFGGPQLLVRTVEQATGLHIDRYVETGLGGYATLVDAVGGVDVCVKRALKDAKAHIDVKKGCQTHGRRDRAGLRPGALLRPARGPRPGRAAAAGAGRDRRQDAVAVRRPGAVAGLPGGVRGRRARSPSTPARRPPDLLAFVQAMRAVAGGGGLSLTVPVGNAALRPRAPARPCRGTPAEANKLFDALRPRRHRGDPAARRRAGEGRRRLSR